MASETFKKRQKEVARKERRLRKVARRMERKAEKARNEISGDGASPVITEPVTKPGATIF
jgi:hypothetical protein